MTFKIKEMDGTLIFRCRWTYPESMGWKYGKGGPNDVHVDVELKGKNGKPEWKPIIGYDKIPDSIEISHDFDLEVSKANPMLKGLRKKIFRVRWTYWGSTEHTDWPQQL